jgi:BatD DUF11 like domain
MHKRLSILIAFLCSIELFLGPSAVSAAALSASAAVAKSDVYVGEPFTFQIQVSGSESPAQPDLSHIDGFNVTFQGGSQNSSTSIQIINGRMTQNVRQGYIFSYQLTPLRKGRLLIPAVKVTANGDTASTAPIRITAREPEETDAFKLHMTLSKTRCYVGEPVILTVTWYLGGDVQSAGFTFPFLENNDYFSIVDQKTNPSSDKQYFRIPLNDGEVIAEKGQGKLNGRAYGTLIFEKVLIPQESGNVAIDPATVSFRMLVGYRRRNSPFNDDFFHNFLNDRFFNMDREGVYKQFVVPSNAVSLKVLDLPTNDRPSDFSGLVGSYHMTAAARPTSVNVGDPITLTIALSGPQYLEPVQLPPLTEQPALSRDFKIPTERAIGEISGDEKIFTQTIRPLRPDVKEIPPITLSYFDTDSRTYRTVETQAIPLAVSATRVVTAKDAEGISTPVPTGSDVETYAGGIAHNYEDRGVLSNQMHNPVLWLASAWGIGTLAVPPALYLLLFTGSVFYRRKKADPIGNRAKAARSRLIKALDRAKRAQTPQQAKIDMLDAVKTYLGSKLRMPVGGALTFIDVGDRLARKGVDEETLDILRAFFKDCEAARYGSATDGDDVEGMLGAVQDLVKRLEKKL